MPPIGGEELPDIFCFMVIIQHYQQDRSTDRPPVCADQIEVCDHYGRGYVVMSFELA